MKLINEIQPSEKTYDINLTQTEVDFICALVANVNNGTCKTHVPELYDLFMRLDTGKFSAVSHELKVYKDGI